MLRTLLKYLPLKYGGTVTPIDSKEMQYAMYQDQHFKEVAVEDANGNRCECAKFGEFSKKN